VRALGKGGGVKGKGRDKLLVLRKQPAAYDEMLGKDGLTMTLPAGLAHGMHL
jgi:hypothetical protein